MAKTRFRGFAELDSSHRTLVILCAGLFWVSVAAGQQGKCPEACDRTKCKIGEDYRLLNSVATYSLFMEKQQCWTNSEVKSFGQLTVQQCAAKVASDPECIWGGEGPGFFMHSSKHPAWGCRCCSARAAAKPPDNAHELWSLYKVESSGCPPDKCCHGCSRFGWCGAGKEWHEGGVDCCGCAPANFDYWRTPGAGSYPNACMGSAQSTDLTVSSSVPNQGATGVLNGKQSCEGRGLRKHECSR